MDCGEELSIRRPLKEESIHLRSAQADVNLATITKPDWAERFWLDDNGVYAAHEEQALFHLQPASGEKPEASWVCLHNPWSWARDCGIDEFGLWADLSLEQVIYRLRWIVPGTFLMGSPETEHDRRGDETQHQVSLTRGFWLGETSCTQAFWQAVMGANPSRFKDDPQLPVEQVSWEDCQQFLSSLQAKQPHFKASLPSEAQWEYACRSGTQTAFSWGNNLSTELANYNANRPYANGKKGEYRERTVPVTAFLPNPWGLYQMHGNVWEWCQDWYGDYQKKDTIDPKGPKHGRNRVLRGGSWISSGRGLRSARRFAVEPDDRISTVGFRLAGGTDPQARQAGTQPGTANRGPWSGLPSGGARLRGEGDSNN
ncbi:MAG: formylglycine-generating enzyme family protein, partial [Gammaproteobacteria bacterium]|nr:formylglycine-generating enzyme family protein [Gammaproteobacteria bacterium]